MVYFERKGTKYFVKECHPPLNSVKAPKTAQIRFIDSEKSVYFC